MKTTTRKRKMMEDPSYRDGILHLINKLAELPTEEKAESRQEFADRWGVSPKTVYRDCRTMVGLGLFKVTKSSPSSSNCSECGDRAKYLLPFGFALCENHFDANHAAELLGFEAKTKTEEAKKFLEYYKKETDRHDQTK